MQLKEKIEQALEQLKSINAEDISLQFNSSVNEELMRQAEQQFTYFPSVLKNIYQQSDGFKFSWYFENESIVVSPKTNFSSLNFLLGGTTNDWNDNAFEDILWFEDTDEETHIEKVKRLKVLDNNSSIGIFILIDLNEPHTPLYIWNNGKLFPTQLKIEQYINALCLTRGVSYWQYLFIDEKNESNIGFRNQLKKSLSLLGIDSEFLINNFK